MAGMRYYFGGNEYAIYSASQVCLAAQLVSAPAGAITGAERAVGAGIRVTHPVWLSPAGTGSAMGALSSGKQPYSPSRYPECRTTGAATGGARRSYRAMADYERYH